MPTVVSVAVAAILAWVVIDDLRHFVIRNIWVAALGLGFVLKCIADGQIQLLPSHGLFALVCFAGLACLFALHAIGGGDAKLLGAALLWVGPEGCLVYAILLLPCTIAYVLGARFAGWPAQRREGRLVIPFGPSIAIAWLAFMAVSAWLGAAQVPPSS